MSLQLSFATLRICSTDVARSRDWYQDFLGLEPVEDLENFVSFRIGGTTFEISVADAKSPSSPGGSVGYWLVPELESVLARAQKLGGRIYRGPLRVDEVRRTIVQIMDPCGNVIGFEAPFESGSPAV